MNLSQLQQSIEQHFSAGPSAIGNESAKEAFLTLRAALESGEVRAASPSPESSTGWCVNAWVKQGILLGFRLGVLAELRAGSLSFVDKNTYPVQHFAAAAGVRVVPGGSSIRAGAFVARGVVCMPPMRTSTYRAGAYVDEGTMVDSHALVGSCAQIGKRVHLSAAAQIGGVLEPVNASPVVIEDDVLVGGNCGRMTRAGGCGAQGRCSGAGHHSDAQATPVFDLVNGTVLKATADIPLIVPENGVVVPGSRAVSKVKGHPASEAWGLSLYAPVIVKYRDDKTDLSTTLEDLLRVSGFLHNIL